MTAALVPIACASCFRGGGGSVEAYWIATAVMAIPPLAMVVGLVLVLRSGRTTDATAGGTATGRCK